MIDTSSFAGTYIYCELSWLHPASFKVNSDLILAISNNWKEKHVDEVLELSLQEGSPAIDKTK